MIINASRPSDNVSLWISMALLSSILWSSKKTCGILTTAPLFILYMLVSFSFCIFVSLFVLINYLFFNLYYCLLNRNDHFSTNSVRNSFLKNLFKFSDLFSYLFNHSYLFIYYFKSFFKLFVITFDCCLFVHFLALFNKIKTYWHLLLCYFRKGPAKLFHKAIGDSSNVIRNSVNSGYSGFSSSGCGFKTIIFWLGISCNLLTLSRFILWLIDLDVPKNCPSRLNMLHIAGSFVIDKTN